MSVPWDQTTLRINAPALGRVRCEPGWWLRPEWSRRLTDLDLWFVWAGRGSMRLEGETVELRPGVCFWMRPGGTYVAEQDASDRLGVTFVHFDLLDRRGRPWRGRGLAGLPGSTHTVADTAFTDALLSRVVELMRAAAASPTDSAAASRAVAEQLLRSTLIELDTGIGRVGEANTTGSSAPRGTAGHHRSLVAAAEARICENPGEAYSVADLAHAAGYSPDHFARVFRQVRGQSPREFIVRQRIDRACRLLHETDMTISQVADALGYPSVFEFSAQFKRKMALSPSRYRATGNA